MAGIKQLAKLRTGDVQIDRAVAHIADTLNPVLRTLPIPADFRFAEVAGLNGAPPTFQLQYRANNAQGWAGIATFTSTGFLLSGGVTAKAHKNAAQSIPNVTFTALDFQVADWDSDSAFTLGAACKWTCPAGKGGKYHVSVAASLAVGAAAVNNLIVSLYVNGVEVSRDTRTYIPVGQFGSGLASDDLNLNAGDYVQAFLYQDSGAALNTESGAVQNHFAIHHIAGA